MIESIIIGLVTGVVSAAMYDWLLNKNDKTKSFGNDQIEGE